MFSALPDTDRCLPDCFGDSDFSPADGWKTRAKLEEICLPVLARCVPCPFRATCIRQTRPHQSRFDGVCGGRLWLDGEVIATAPFLDDRDLPMPGKERAICGTPAGWRRHYAVGEQSCDPCSAFAPEDDPESDLPPIEAAASVQLALVFAA
ncbi:hypothetical protein ACWEO1_01425 [Kitasatospora cineracea]